MLQLFHLLSDVCYNLLYLDVLKVDRVLHFSSRFTLLRLGVFSSGSSAAPSLYFSMLVMFGVARAARGREKRVRNDG
jgi:hypothetical protein